MALLTGKGMESILRRIMDKSDIEDEEMIADIERLRSDFSEREGILRNYGDVSEGDDDYDFVEKSREDGDGWKEKYNRLRKQYTDRFFGSSDVKEDFEEIMDETVEDVERDGTVQTIDELLERVEG